MAKKTPPPGHPTLYKPEYCEQLIEYFSEPPYEVIRNEERPSDFKSLAAFANRLGVHRDTLHEWSKQHPEFSDAYKRAKQYQEEWLTVNGNKGLINPAFSIFTAKNVLQWRDKQPDENDNININVNSALADKMAKARTRKK